MFISRTQNTFETVPIYILKKLGMNIMPPNSLTVLRMAALLNFPAKK
jgi:hypothetical protein